MSGSRARTVAERLLLPSPFLDGAAFREDSTAHILGQFPRPPHTHRGGRKTPPLTPYPTRGDSGVETGHQFHTGALLLVHFQL